MRVMDNSPIDVPAVGILVKEQYAVGQLADCCLYALPSNMGTMVEKAKEVFDGFMKSIGADKLLNKYDFEELGRMPALDNHALLGKAIEDEKCQFIMPLYTPSKPEKQYLLLNTEVDRLYNDIALMLYTSERVSKFCVAEQMKIIAQEQPAEMQEFIREYCERYAFLKRYVTGTASNMVHPTFGMAMSKSVLKEKIGIKGKITHQDKLKMMENVEENFVKARRDENLDAQITLLIQSMDAEDIKQFVYSLNKRQQGKFFQVLNTKRIGEEADAWLEIRYEGKIESSSRTKGRYRLCVNKGEKTELVEFANSDSFLIHLLYIIEKVLADDVNTMDFERYKDLFVKLSWEVYRSRDGEERFKKIIKGRDAEGNSKERRLSDCLGDIKNSVSMSCKKLGVLPSPYYIENADEHLYVSKKDILLPKELLEVIDKWKNSI